MAPPRNSTRPNGRPRYSMEEHPTGGDQPSLCVAYLILTGTSGWALKHASTSTTYALGTFGFLLGHSLLGFFHTTSPDPGDIVRSVYRQTSLLAEVAPLSLMNAEFYLVNGYGAEFAYLHLASAFLPIIANLAVAEHTCEVTDLTVLGNVGSLLYLQLTKDTGPWTGGLIALSALNHFVFKQLAYKYGISKVEIVTIGLSFFTVFALNSLRDLKA